MPREPYWCYDECDNDENNETAAMLVYQTNPVGG